MGGDHKCPVCSATFTRPQHVVRHMRSHTGDRPYKCQHCGDQFSRSDLLSRHVNKCHVGEKALGPGGAPAEGQGRRKGIGASTTRATTSKQACDQCVQSSLPCDGCNPCAKCIQRKVRCTFVKFHRQTAPIGPGHNPSRTANSSSSVSSSILPLPHIPSQQSAAGFNPAVTQAYDSIYGTYDLPSSMAPLGYTAEEAPFILQPAPGSSTSYANNYRAQQADLHRRASFPPINPSGQTWISGWQGNPENATPTSFAPENHFAFDVANDLRNQPFPLRHPHQNPTQTQNQNQNQHVYGQHPHNPNATTSTRSFSSSSSSSNHDHDSRPGTASDISDGPSRPGTSSSFGSRPGTSGGTDPSSSSTNRNENPAFSSAFGLMSLDDPAVLAGLANDGAPFFSHLTGVDPTAAAAAAAAANGTLDGGIQSMGGGAGVGGDGVPTTTGFVGVGGMRNNDPDATPMPIGEAQSLGLVGAGSQAPSNTGVNGSSPKQLHHFPSRGRPSTGHGHGLGNGGSTLGIGGGGGELGTPGRDAETKELRDFWKAYMRTPLSGPGSGGGGMLGGPSTSSSSSSSSSDAHVLSASSPSGVNNGGSPGYRRQRVSSLPSVKTPTAISDEDRYASGFVGFGGGYGVSHLHRNYQPYQQQLLPPLRGSSMPLYHPGQPHAHAHAHAMSIGLIQQQQHPGLAHPHPHPHPHGRAGGPAPGETGGRGGGGGGATRLHVGNGEDLRSYEAAVLARKAPVILSMEGLGEKMRRKAGGGGGTGSTPPALHYQHQHQHHQHQHPPGVLSSSSSTSSPSLSAALATSGSSPSSVSSSSVTSSPALSQNTPGLVPLEDMSAFGGSAAAGGMGGMIGIIDGIDIDGGATNSRRPSFKRGASQVLEKSGSGKLARRSSSSNGNVVGVYGDDDDDDDEDDEDDDYEDGDDNEDVDVDDNEGGGEDEEGGEGEEEGEDRHRGLAYRAAGSGGGGGGGVFGEYDSPLMA